MLITIKEKKVYIIDCAVIRNTIFDFRDLEQIGDYDKIKEKAKELKTILTLQEFQDKINNDELDLSNSFILID